MSNSLGEYQKGARKTYIVIICTRIPFKHIFTSSFPPAQLYPPETCPSPPHLSLSFPVPSCHLLGLELLSGF